MPLSPSPLLPGVSPLPPAGAQPPSAGARRLAVVIALPTLIVLLIIGQVFLPKLLFLAPGLQAQAQVNEPGKGDASFQGFQFTWDRTQSGGGYSTPMSLQNMKSQAQDFHMNAVIIPIIADMPDPNDSYIAWRPTDAHDVHTLPDADYIKAINDAKSAGLLPILELQILQETTQFTDPSPAYIGSNWANSRSEERLAVASGSQAVGALEKAWFDNYTAFATHWAQISESNNLPYFIIGDGLINMTYDTSATSYKGDPGGHDRTTAGEPPCTNGRRDCSWRHVIHGLKQASYLTLSSHQSEVGGGYSGKLIYGASWGSASDQGVPGTFATTPEFSSITWWDAVDMIGVDANFPLVSQQISPTLETLENSWIGQGQNLGDQGNIYSKLDNLSGAFNRPIVFTSVEYDSATGASSGTVLANQEDDAEQEQDMQALLFTFAGTSWWTGVFWSADQPLYPRTKQPNWSVFGNWAGDDLKHAKDAGVWLSTYYKANPIAIK